MQVFFQTRDAEAARFRELAMDRVRFAMRRLDWMRPTAHVQFNDINGPRGGVDKQCRITLRSEGAGSVVITSMAPDWRPALDTALSRAATALMRNWQRRRGPGSRFDRNRFNIDGA